MDYRGLRPRNDALPVTAQSARYAAGHTLGFGSACLVAYKTKASAA